MNAPSTLNELRNILNQKACPSETSYEYQNDALSYVVDCLGAGDSVIEVGVFNGGLSSQLAFVMENSGKKLFLVEISRKHLDKTRSLITELNIATEVIYFHGDLDRLNSSHIIEPSTVIIDANHDYVNVKNDISSLRKFPAQPACTVFHDNGLRYIRKACSIKQRVDRAIYEDYIAKGFRYIEVGQQQLDSSTISSADTSQLGYYFDSKTREGMLIVTNAGTFEKYCPWGFVNSRKLISQ